MMTTHRLSLGPTHREIAEQVASNLETVMAPRAEALSIFEAEPSNSCWQVDAYYASAEDAGRAATLAVALGIVPQAIRLEVVERADWVRHSLKALAPVWAGRFFIHGSHDRARKPPNSTAIEIDAATAFGTGHHGTTLGCLLALDHVLRTENPQSMIDVGCGSGILAIAYSKAARRAAVACDNDPEAVRISSCNARLNGASVTTLLADGAKHPSLAGRRFELIMANILARPLVTLAPRVACLAARDSCLVLSGLLANQRQWIASVYRSWGFTPERDFAIEGWVTLLLRYRQGEIWVKRANGR